MRSGPVVVMSLWAVLAVPAGPARADPEQLLRRAGCTGCHAPERKLVGPAFKDIAARYRDRPGAVALLMDKVRKGGKGSFGPVPMPATPPERIPDADLRTAIEWMLRH